MPLVKQHNTWAQAAGKGLPNVGNSPSDCNSSAMENDQDNSSGSSSKVNRMEENVKESQIAAAFSEGWGQRGINQDTAWEVPSSPHLSPKESSTWNSSTSTGTEIWENSIRHHIKSSTDKPPPQIREPWGHTPSTHLGGTWGEEDNFEDNVIPDLYPNTSSNLLPHNNNNNWQCNKGDTSAVWGANPPDNKTWASQNHAMSAHIGEWGVKENDKDDGVPEIPEIVYDMTPTSRPALWDNYNSGRGFPRSVTKGVEGKPWPNQNNSMLPPNWGGDSSVLQINTQNFLISNDNKSVDDIGPHNGPQWAGDAPHKGNRAFGNWSGSPVTSDNKKLNPSGWEETNPSAHQSGSNYDDGTALWGNPVHQGKVSHWKEMPPNKQMPNMPPNNMCQNNIPGPGMIRLPQVNMNKNDNSWMKNQNLNHNLSWSDMQSHRDTSAPRIWDEVQSPISHDSISGTPNTPNSAFGNGGAGDSSHLLGNYWPPKPKNPSCNWADGQIDTSSWGGPLKQGGKPLTKDLIWASKQFRLLAECNYKKEDIENALRRHNMNLNDAFVELKEKEKSLIDVEGLSGLNLNQPPMHRIGGDDLNLSEHSLGNSIPPGNLYGSNDFSGMGMFSSGLNVAQNVKNQSSAGNNIAPNLLGSTGSNNQVPNFNQNNGINNLSPAMMRKILQQTQAFNPACLSQNPGQMAQQSFPPAAQLRLMVQQIQMAVQAGHLNPMILNQALAPATLQLLYQLLQQIRFLHQLQQQQMFFTQHATKPGSPPLQLSVQITQTKQHIVNLQNQIAAQQALFLKQQLQLPKQQQQPASLQNPQPSTFDVKSNLDTMNGLHNEFRDLSIKDVGPQGHSRLNQWKLPSFDKEDNPPPAESNAGQARESSSGEFSRAPGSITKSSSANSLSSNAASHSSANLTPLTENSWPRSQSDSTSEPMEANASVQSTSDNLGSSNDASSDGNTKHSSASDNKDVPASSNPSTSSSSQSYNLNDLVPEFEPGKPWKGTSRIKNFEDDPHVTPGSIAKSPLSLTSIKDSDLFSWNVKPNGSNITTSPLTSSTWTYSPPPTSSSQNRQGMERSWSGNNNRSSTEQDQMNWKGPPQATQKAPQPPPGLGNQNKSDWMPGGEPYPQDWSLNIGSEKQRRSNFLVLKNLTPQIDGSTLKTLCLQHGPLERFHLLLNHGIALVRYSTREETEKARAALNNCVLSNTTILVDIPTEMEVKRYLQRASIQPSRPAKQPGGSWPSGNGSADSSYSSCGTFPGSATTTSPSSGGGGSSKAGTVNWNNSGLNLQGSHLWSYSGSGNSLWGMQTATSDHDQCIPSSLNSFLPNDLLGGGESI